MNLRRASSFLGVMAVAAPLAVSTPDSSVTSFRVAGGRGSYGYVTRGCEGVIDAQKINVEDAGVDVSHKFTAPVRVGMRAGIIRPREGRVDLHYVNPYLSQEGSLWSIGLGYLYSDRQLPDGGSEDFRDSPEHTVSGHIRFGKKVYGSISYLEDVPITTGGYAQAGVGVRGQRFHFWGGLGVVPHDELGIVAKTDVRVWRGLSIGAIGRLGRSEGITENGLAFTLSYAWVHRGDPVPEDVRETIEPVVPGDSLGGGATQPID